MERYAMSVDNKTKYGKMSVLPNLIFRFNAIPIKIPASYFVNFDKLVLKFIWRAKDPE